MVRTPPRWPSPPRSAADACEIYTDVDGVYTADPNVVHDARKIDRISYEEMLELASVGAKVLQTRSVEFGMKYRVPIHVRSSFNDNQGTWVVPEEKAMESVLVAGVTATRDEAKITLSGVVDKPGVQAQVLRPLATAGIVVDVIVQAHIQNGRTNLTFTLPSADLARAREILIKTCADICPRIRSRPRRTCQRFRWSGSACVLTRASRSRCSRSSPRKTFTCT